MKLIRRRLIMDKSRVDELKKVSPKLALGLLGVESFTLPIFRSGGRTGLSFWGWIVNHTIFGPPVEYVPVEDYARELQGAFPWYPVQNAQTFKSLEAAMHYFKCDEAVLKDMIRNGAVSIVAGDSKIKEYGDLLANVRYDGRYHSVRALIQPDDPEVRDSARLLIQSNDFIVASQELVDSFTTYRMEVGDYWAEPWETLEARAGDCDDKSILLCSLLRNYIPADQVYCAFGIWSINGDSTGHMWVVTVDENGDDRIIESTAGPEKKTKGRYIIHGIFNDQYAFATDIGLREFGLKTLENIREGVR
jgi:hypothetical protein